MSNMRIRFARELDALLGLNNDDGKRIERIANWAFSLRFANQREVDVELDTWLVHLGAMTMGEEFEFTDEEMRRMVASSAALI
ncbi:hypothetical protein [Luteibacter sp.]|uniref:hypothetical protein n=1 Tax=Luteibacter sp. TaxID=1886636 RepID=UPI003F7FEA5D